MRTVTHPSFARPARVISLSRPRMRRPSALPTIIPTRSSWLQRMLWLFVRER